MIGLRKVRVLGKETDFATPFYNAIIGKLNNRSTKSRRDAVSENKPAVAVTKAGKVEGILEGGLYVFKGIPYAAPPVGSLRWMAPQPHQPWTGIRSAQKFGAIAPQTLMPGGPMVQVEQPQSEDCLFLNVWTPALDNAKRPVMVWIHGGAFTLGSSSDPQYTTDKLAKKGGIVFVSINYRLGMLGFLRLKDATGGKIPSTGNEGFLDQVAALKWVKDNISSFGGDPDNVTVFGESAGSMSIACLMVMPAAKGLFKKGILESGAGSVAVPKAEANKIGEIFLQVSGLKKDDVKGMRALTAKQLLDLEMKMRIQGAGPGEAMKITSTTPVTDGEVIPDFLIKLARAGAGKGISTIIGTNLDEWKLFAMMQPGYDKADEAAMMQRLESMLTTADAKKMITAYKAALTKRGGPVTPPELLSAIQTDIMFRIPALELVEAQRDNQAPVYNYLFDWKSPVMGGILGACHALEVGFVMGNNDDMMCGTGPEADKLSAAMQDAWIAFAKTGNPSAKATGDWPTYGKDRKTMILGKNIHVEAAPYEAERSAWAGVKRADAVVI
jgi:para-nitrobenzyl esterase